MNHFEKVLSTMPYLVVVSNRKFKIGTFHGESGFLPLVDLLNISPMSGSC